MADIGKGLFLLMILAVLLGVGIVVWDHVTDPRIQAHRAWELDLAEQSRARLQPTLDLAKQAMIIIGILFLAGMALVLFRFLDSRVQRVYPMRGGLYPAREVKPSLFQRAAAFLLGKPMPETYFLSAPNQSKAQLAYAAANGLNPGVRLSAGVWRQLMKPDETDIAGELTAGPPQVSVEDVTTVNLRTDPHIFIVGTSGSGKSTATYAMAKALNEVGAEFVICERWRRTWYTQANATTTETIEEAVNAVYLEYIRRQQLLDEHDAQHIADLRIGPGPLVLLIEEFADWWAKMRQFEKSRVEQLRSEMQELGREGRKAGITMMLVSQSPVSDVIDGELRKNMNVLLFRSEFSVDRTWGVPEWADLPSMPTGTAYSVRHGALVTFPNTTRRPELRVSEIYHEPRGTMQRYIRGQLGEDVPLLPDDAGADNNPDGSDMPDGVAPGVIGSLGGVTDPQGGVIDGEYTRLQGVTDTPGEVRSHSNGPQGADLVARARDAMPVALDASTQLDEQQNSLIWQVLMLTLKRDAKLPLYSMRQVHETLWPDIQPGGHRARLIREAVTAEAAKRHYTVRIIEGQGILFARANGRPVRINGGRQ